MKARNALCLAALALLVMGANPHPAQAQQPSLSVIYEDSLGQHFGIYSQTIQHIALTISGFAGIANQSTVVSTYFSFVFTGISGVPDGGNYSVQVVSQHPFVAALLVTLPKGNDSFDFTITGASQDTSIFYRGSALITEAFVSVNAPPYNPTSYQVLIPTSSRSQIVSVYPGTGPGLTTQYVIINGTSYLSTGFSFASATIIASTITIIYQPQYFNYFLVALVVLALGAGVGAGLILRGGRKGVTGLLGRGKTILYRIIEPLNSKRILALLVVVSVLMIAIAYAFGPSPAPRAYLAATPNTATTLAPFISGAGFTYLTPLQAGDEFDVMSGLGTYSTVIVADYPPAWQSAGFLSSSSIIAISEYANATLVHELQSYFGSTVTVVNNTQQLQSVLSGMARGYSSNHLGLPVSEGAYNAATTIEGLLSLSIPFLALAFFARYMIESVSKGIVKLAQGVAFSFFVFLFGELVYIQTGVLLGLPVALHATISSQETAVGALGFGGGTRPREVLGILGFLFGTVSGTVKGPKIDKVALSGILATLVFLVLDPLQLGLDFYNIVLLLGTSSPGTAVGQVAWTQLRGFIQYFMNAFGDYIVPTYYSQHGAVLFFVGAVPFALYTYVRKSTATLLLFFSAIVGGLGYVRIGDQDPLKAIASTTPGFAMAVLFIVAFLAFDRVERFLRSRLG